MLLKANKFAIWEVNLQFHHYWCILQPINGLILLLCLNLKRVMKKINLILKTIYLKNKISSVIYKLVHNL